MNTQELLQSYFKKGLGLVLGLALFMGPVQPASAVSVYSVAYNPVSVGTPTDLELEYTVDVTNQTWADNDTLTFTLPANIGQDWLELNPEVEFDQDDDNDLVGETEINAGGGPGQYSLSGNVLTVRWNEAVWTAENGDTIRVVVEDAVFDYADATTSFTFGGTTAAGGDTNPSYVLDIEITAADAAATVTLGDNSVVGTAGDTTVTLTLPLALDADDTVMMAFPSHMNVADVAFGSETFAGAGTFSTCSDAGQVVTCTANGAITAGTGNIVLTGITSKYAASTDMSGLGVLDEGSDDIATDDVVALTNSTAADAAATVTLGTNSVVGETGDTTVNFTLQVDLDADDTIDITFPSYMVVSGVAFGSESFAGAGTFSGCAAAGQVVTCTASGAISAGIGTLVLTGIEATEAGTTDITSFEVEDEGVAANDIATDSDVAMTDTTVRSSGVPAPGSGGSSSSSSNDDDDEEDTEEVFTDLDESSEYYDAIMDLYERDIVDGHEDGSIKAEEGINRAELMKIIVLAVTDEPDASDYNNCFTDVADDWYAPMVCYAKEQGWVQGYPDNSFGPGLTANNVEVLKMIMEVNGVEVPEAAEGEEWYTPYVTLADEMGLIDENDFDAGEPCVRGYAFTLLSDLIGMLE